MHWSQWMALISGSLATFLNLSLLPLILLYSSKKIGAYKYCLLFYTMTAAMMTICQINTLVAWYAPPNGYIFYATVALYPVWFQFFFIYGFVASFIAILMIVCWSFLARLTTLTGSELFKLPLKTKPKCLLIGAILLYILLLLDVSLIHKTEENMRLFTPTIREISHVELENVAFIAAPVMVNGCLSWRLTVCLCVMTTYFLAVTIWVVICWWKIGQRLNALRRLQAGSTANLKIQSRLYILLSLQAFLPLFFNSSPLFFVMIVSLTQIDLGNLIIICGAMISFAQILDPISTLILVSDYRRGLLKLVGLQKPRVSGVTSSGHGARHSDHHY